jgi:hypothetical protein
MFARQQEFVIAPNGMKQEVVLVLPNYHESMQSRPIIMEMDFIVNEDKYYYSFSIVNEGKEISQEVLYKNKKKIFTRENHKISIEADIKKKIGKLADSIVAPKKSSFVSILLDDSSDISVFSNLKEEIGISELKKIEHHMCFITDKRTVQLGQNNISGLMAFAINYLNSDAQTASEKIGIVNSIVKYFEPSFDRLNIEKIGDSSPNNNPFSASLTIKYEAKYNNFYKELGVMELSAGTRELISYISDVLNIIKIGGIVVYDETSKFYHPDMEIAILNLFKDRDINKNNAQLFFSSHNHETFDLLQNDQAHIVEKKNDSITISKVSDFDVKERDNIKRIYRLGSIGGVPDTIDFNRVINNLL